MHLSKAHHHHQVLSSIGRCCSKTINSCNNHGPSRRTLVYSSRHYIPPHRRQKTPPPLSHGQFKRAQNQVGGIVVAGMAVAGGLGSAVIMAQSEGPDDDDDDVATGTLNNNDTIDDATSSSSPSTLRQRDFPLREHSHGKTRVRILKVLRDTNLDQHAIFEYNVETKLFCKDYAKCFTNEDNTDLVATDTQRNAVYVVAKRCGPDMATPEDFGIALCKHFLQEYSTLEAVEVRVEQVLWERVVMEHHINDSSPETSLLVSHPHAFIKQAPETYACQVRLDRTDDGKFVRRLTSSIQKMTILKTTQSGFEGYLQDKYTLLPPTRERCLATELDATWTFPDEANTADEEKVDYGRVRQQVRLWLLHGIFGPPPTGVYSASLQATIYDAACLVLDHVPQVTSIKIDTPNLHYIPFMQLHQLGEKFENDIFLPTSEPSGSITCRVTRN